MIVTETGRPRPRHSSVDLSRTAVRAFAVGDGAAGDSAADGAWYTSAAVQADIVLCVCTWRRPAGLRRLLAAASELEYDGRLAVVVVDNDAAAEGIAVCRDTAAAFRWPLAAVQESRPGISYARNSAVERALELRPRFIAMLDDDEWPSRGWLRELVRVLDTTGADVVGGPVIPRFPPAAGIWPALADVYTVNLRRPDGAPCTLYAAGNFIARADCFRALGPAPFDPGFARTGGEDLVFFCRLARLGFRMHWSAAAEVYETVTADRMSLTWLTRRQRRRGSLNVVVQRMFAPGPIAEAMRLTKTAGLLSLALGYRILAAPFPVRRLRAILLLHKALGKVAGHLGRRITQYGDSSPGGRSEDTYGS